MGLHDQSFAPHRARNVVRDTQNIYRWIAVVSCLGLAHMACGLKAPPPAPSAVEAPVKEKSEVTPPPAATPSPATNADPSLHADAGADADAPPIRPDGTVLGEAELMGTRVSINVYVGQDGDAGPVGKAITDAFYEIARIESIASEWIPESELSQLGEHAGGDWMHVSPELMELLERSVTISASTKGLFDVTFHSVGRLWSFKAGATPPDPKAVKKALELVDYRYIELDPKTMRARLSRAGVRVGMGAIAKGYGVDRAALVLRKSGIQNFIVEAGGDTYVSGTKGSRKWTVGVQDPAGPGALGSIEAQGEAIVTSGNYERYFVHDGVYYTHIIDPRTGYPIERSKSPRSVTVVADNATDADAYCTAVTVMGRTQGLAFVDKHPKLEAVIVDADGSVHLSAGLKDRYRPLSSPTPTAP